MQYSYRFNRNHPAGKNRTKGDTPTKQPPTARQSYAKRNQTGTAFLNIAQYLQTEQPAADQVPDRRQGLQNCAGAKIRTDSTTEKEGVQYDRRKRNTRHTRKQRFIS